MCLSSASPSVSHVVSAVPSESFNHTETRLLYREPEDNNWTSSLIWSWKSLHPSIPPSPSLSLRPHACAEDVLTTHCDSF